MQGLAREQVGTNTLNSVVCLDSAPNGDTLHFGTVGLVAATR